MVQPESGAGLHSVNDPNHIQAQIEEYRRIHLEEADDSPRAPSEAVNPEAAFDLVIRGRQILTSAGLGAREVGVRNGRVVAIEPLGSGLPGDTTLDLAADETLIPGLVDTHVHVNEPGRTEWEGFATATKAAAAGGVTTIIDMPLNSIPSTVNGPALELKRLHARRQVFVDVGFWGGAVPGNRADLRELHDEGVFGFKCFLLHSGVANFAFYREGFARAATRLSAYVTKSGSGVLDEPATAWALARYLYRGYVCGALEEAELQTAVGLTPQQMEQLARPKSDTEGVTR